LYSPTLQVTALQPTEDFKAVRALPPAPPERHYRITEAALPCSCSVWDRRWKRIRNLIGWAGLVGIVVFDTAIAFGLGFLMYELPRVVHAHL